MSHFEALILKSRYGNVDGFSLVGKSIKEIFTNGTVETLLSTGIYTVDLAIDKDNLYFFLLERLHPGTARWWCVRIVVRTPQYS